MNTYYHEIVKQMRSYILKDRPQSFAMTWNLFVGLLAKTKSSPKDVEDIFRYARKERIERFGSEIDVSMLYEKEPV